MIMKRLVSSANKCMLELMPLTMSVMKGRKRRGPEQIPGDYLHIQTAKPWYNYNFPVPLAS